MWLSWATLCDYTPTPTMILIWVVTVYTRVADTGASLSWWNNLSCLHFVVLPLKTLRAVNIDHDVRANLLRSILLCSAVAPHAAALGVPAAFLQSTKWSYSLSPHTHTHSNLPQCCLLSVSRQVARSQDRQTDRQTHLSTAKPATGDRKQSLPRVTITNAQLTRKTEA